MTSRAEDPSVASRTRRTVLGRVSATRAVVAALVLALSTAAGAVDDMLPGSTWNPLNPRSPGHFRVADPANVSAEEAEAAYRALAEEMAARYALSGLAPAAEYQGWRRYNTAPYTSIPHGRRYLNHYANGAAKTYGRYEDAGAMPAGAVLAKDSFSIGNSGDVLPGPLFLMEKLEPGASPESGDWRYTMILPDGSILGTTGGENAKNVAFCVACHEDAGERQDRMFFPPKPFRGTFGGGAN